MKVRPAKGQQQLIYLLEIMAKLEIARSTTFYTFLESDIQSGMTGYDILLLTCFVSERLQDQIKALRERGNAVEILLLTEEGELEEVYV